MVLGFELCSCARNPLQNWHHTRHSLRTPRLNSTAAAAVEHVRLIEQNPTIIQRIAVGIYMYTSVSKFQIFRSQVISLLRVAKCTYRNSIGLRRHSVGNNSFSCRRLAGQNVNVALCRLPSPTWKVQPYCTRAGIDSRHASVTALTENNKIPNIYHKAHMGLDIGDSRSAPCSVQISE